MTDELSQAVETGKIKQPVADQLALLAPEAFCTHKSWGFGRVAGWNLDADQILIDFAKRKNHPMRIDYAVESLTPIPNDHILARAATDKDAVLASAREDAIGLVRSIIDNLGGKATSDEIAATLVPTVFDTPAFKRWWDATRKKMKADGHFKMAVKKTDPFEILDAPVNSATGILETFRAARHPKDQLAALDLLSKSIPDLAANPDEAKALVSQIADIAQRLHRLQPAAAIEMLVTRDQIVDEIKDLEPDPAAPAIASILKAESSRLAELVNSIPGSRQRHVLEQFEAAFGEQWTDKALSILNNSGPRLIADTCRLFEKSGKRDELRFTLERWISERSTSSELLIWLCKERQRRFPELFNPELLAAVFSALEADLLAEKRGTRLRDLLVDDRELVGDLLKDASRDVVRDSMRKLMLTPAFDDLSKRSLMARIVKLYPDTQDMISKEKGGERAQALTVSWASLEKRKKEFDHLVEKEIPGNLRDINIAKEQGDLRENAGFKAAKEHQRVLQTRRAEMERELANARGTNFENPPTDKVSIGTVVTVELADASTETFSILGAWDSAPELGIISYKTALGQALVGAAPGDPVELPSESGSRPATIRSIAPFTDLALLTDRIHRITEN